jgi:ATP-dependent Lon protease
MTDDSKPITPEIVEDENEPGEERQLVQQTMKPDILYLVPITGRPHLPAQVQPLMVSKKKWEETLIKAAEDSRGLLGIAYIKEIKG